MGSARECGRVLGARQHVRVQQREHGAHAHAAAARLHAQPHARHQPLQPARRVAAVPAASFITIYNYMRSGLQHFVIISLWSVHCQRLPLCNLQEDVNGRICEGTELRQQSGEQRQEEIRNLRLGVGARWLTQHV